MAMTYTVIGPVVKRVTRNINKPPKDPKPQKGGASPFENAIEALSPLAWYRFREPNFTTRVKDSTANGYHLTKQIAAATRSAVPTRTTHPGGAYFPVVAGDDWATDGTFYKGTDGLLNGATEYTLLISFRITAAPNAITPSSKMFGIGTENAATTSSNDLLVMSVIPGAPGDPHRVTHYTTGTSLVSADFAVTELIQDGVNRLAIVRYKRSTPLYSLTTSKPGHLELIEESVVATSGAGLGAISRHLLLNTYVAGLTNGAQTSVGMVIDQIAVFSTDIGASAATDLHSKWSDELAGYYPSMMLYGGSADYYSRASVSTSGNKVTITGTIQCSAQAGTGARHLLVVSNGTANGRRVNIQIGDVSHPTYPNRLWFGCRTASAFTCNIYSGSAVADGNQHTFFLAYDGDAGTAIFCLDGVTTGHTVASVTTGTLNSGSLTFEVGDTTLFTADYNGELGFFGYRDAYLTNHADFMDGNLPKAIDEKNWTEWGAQPAVFSHTGQLDNNKGSAGDFTVNGTITMTTGGSP